MGLKNLIIFLVMLIGVEAGASTMNNSDKEIVEKVAKSLRKDFWQAGHQDVSTSVHHMSLDALDKHFDPSKRYFTHLNADEVEAVYQCHYEAVCEVYLISLSSSYWSGYGIEAFFVTLNTVSKSHELFTHTVYSE